MHYDTPPFYNTIVTMRKFLCVFMFSVLVNLQLNSQTYFTQTHQIDSVLIHYADFNLMTVVDIGCDNFESSLSYEKVIFRDSISIAAFKDLLLKQKCKTEQPIDVRCKIYMFTSQGVMVACLGNHILHYDNNSYKISGSFINKMNEFISKGERPIKDTIIRDMPVLLTKQTTFYDCIKQECLPIMKSEGMDSLKIMIHFCIDREGYAVDIAVKGIGSQAIPVSLRNKIAYLFQDKMKWSSSKNRPSRIRKTFPFMLVSE